MSTITAVFVVKIKPLGAKGLPGAISKSAVVSACVASIGLEGDEQGNQVQHGGPDKVVHHYPSERYDYWRAAGLKSSLLEVPASFDENVTTLGMTEVNVCVGDISRTGPGDPILQVSQPRWPCWRTGAQFGAPRLVADVQRAGRTGWHYRALENGLKPGTAFELIECPHPDWPLSRLLDVLYIDPNERPELENVAGAGGSGEGRRLGVRSRRRRASVLHPPTPQRRRHDPLAPPSGEPFSRSPGSRHLGGADWELPDSEIIDDQERNLAERCNCRGSFTGSACEQVLFEAHVCFAGESVPSPSTRPKYVHLPRTRRVSESRYDSTRWR